MKATDLQLAAYDLLGCVLRDEHIADALRRFADVVEDDGKPQKSERDLARKYAINGLTSVVAGHPWAITGAGLRHTLNWATTIDAIDHPSAYLHIDDDEGDE